MTTLDYAIITSTAIVSFIGLAVAIHTFLGTRKLRHVPDKPTPAPKRKTPGIVVEIDGPGLSEKDVRDFNVDVHYEIKKKKTLLDVYNETVPCSYNGEEFYMSNVQLTPIFTENYLSELICNGFNYIKGVIINDDIPGSIFIKIYVKNNFYISYRRKKQIEHFLFLNIPLGIYAEVEIC